MSGSVVLIGMMGAGKSRVGKGLSKRLGLPLCDTDAQIAAETGLSIKMLIETKGIGHFRTLETKCLKALNASGVKRCIATGGGIVLAAENRQLLRQLGTCIYLKASADTLNRRLIGETLERPLLRTADVATLLDERAALYEATAHATVVTDAMSVEAIIDKICEVLYEHTGS